MEDINTAKPLTDGVDVAPAGGESAVSEEVVSFKDLIAKELGKTFPDDETALKAVKDTFSYVGEYGKVRPALQQLQVKYGPDYINKLMELNTSSDGQQNTPAIDTSKFVTQDELSRREFFAEHSDFKPYRSIIEAMAQQTGKPLTEVVELPEVKTLFTNAKAYEEVEKTKSVLPTNPRLGVAADNVSQSRDLLKQGDVTGATNAAMNAVLEAYDMK